MSEQEYIVQVNSRTILRVKRAVLIFFMVIMLLPTGFFIWPEDVPNRQKWIYRGRLLLLYFAVAIFMYSLNLKK